MTVSFDGAILLDDAGIRRALMRISHEIVERNQGASDVILVGIRRRGVPLAHRIARNLEAIEGVLLPVGIVDIGLYRDDWAERPFAPVSPTQLSTVSGKVVVLVDDVLFTGRTIRAALDAISDFGRPRAIQVAVLVDRGHRELPIRADYVGKNVPTSRHERVRVAVDEIDGIDHVIIEKALS